MVPGLPKEDASDPSKKVVLGKPVVFSTSFNVNWRLAILSVFEEKRVLSLITILPRGVMRVKSEFCIKGLRTSLEEKVTPLNLLV